MITFFSKNCTGLFCMLVGKQPGLYFGKDCQPDVTSNFTKQHIALPSFYGYIKRVTKL